MRNSKHGRKRKRERERESARAEKREERLKDREERKGQKRGLVVARDAHSIGLSYVCMYVCICFPFSQAAQHPLSRPRKPEGVRACQRVLSPAPSLQPHDPSSSWAGTRAQTHPDGAPRARARVLEYTIRAASAPPPFGATLVEDQLSRLIITSYELNPVSG